MGKDKIGKLIILILFLFTILTPTITISSAPTGENTYVPLTGMEYKIHVIVFYFIWPQLLSILFVVIFPLIFVPLFLFIKSKIWYNYQNAYVDMGELKFSLKIFFKRGIYISLLVIGLIITFSSFIEPKLFLVPDRLEGSNYPDNLIFDPDVISSLIFLFLPFVVGIWSVGWTLEDVGLMHYKFPKKNKQMLFEIEPIHLKYNGVFKGYAGISSILFLITAIIVYVSIWPPHLLQVVATILGLMFYTVPAYFVYMIVVQKVFRKLYRKGLKEIEQLTEENITLK
ncbi:MAG: hypothetical protein ACFFAO_17070 [Candidatus Hermodarchaeota archaeon]